MTRASGADSARWKGGVNVEPGGYRRLTTGPMTVRREHTVIAERVLGRPLPKGAEVHHVNEDKLDNSPGNLVICNDRAYHALLHRRQRALNACGNANYRKCVVCKRYDDPAFMMAHTKKQDSMRHRGGRPACERRAQEIK